MKVLLATDGSKNAAAAGWFLSHLSHAKTLDLTVMAVNFMREMHGSIEVVGWMQRDFEREKAKAVEACHRIEQMFEGANARVQTAIVEGHPGETIVEEAKKRSIDLIVIGAVGHSLFDRMLLGSVSDFVATHARCSVLVVRPDRLRELEHRSFNVCVAYDDSDACKMAIRRFGEFDWSRNTKIDLVSMISLPYSYTEIPVEIDVESIKSATMKTVEGAAEDLKKISSSVNAHVLESVHVGDGIVQFATKHSSDLILMGDTGRGLLGRFLVGSVSRFVLRHASCSVWIARNSTK